MNIENKDTNEFLDEFFSDATVITDAEIQELGDSIAKIKDDPSFQAHVLKDDFVHTVMLTMEELELNANQLAKKWGKSRQYLSKLLRTDNLKNYTLDTLVGIMWNLGKRVEIQYPKQGEVNITIRYIGGESIRPKLQQVCRPNSVSNLKSSYESILLNNSSEVPENELFAA